MSNFSDKKKKKSKIISATNQKRFYIKKSMEKSVQIAKVSRRKIETRDQKTQLSAQEDWEKKEDKNDSY